MTRTTSAHAAVMLLVVPLALVGWQGGLWHSAAISLANLVAVLALATQFRRGAYTDRFGWVVMTAGMLVLLVHNAEHALTLLATGTADDGAFSLLSLLAGYALLLTGGMLVTVPYARGDGGGIIDAAVIGLAAASLVWALVLAPAHRRLGSSPATMLYDMALLLLITAMSGAVVRAAVTAREARPSALYLLAAITATNIANTANTLVEASQAAGTESWIAGLWVVAYLAFAAGVVHPSGTAIAGPERPPQSLTRRRLAFLGAALAVDPAIAGIQQALGRPVDITLLSVGALLIVPLVVTRIGLLARWHADAVSRLHHLASLDELTGLPNRRTLTAHLDAALDRTAQGISPGTVVLYLDLDDFKAVNDNHGHTSGDRLLQAVAARVRGCVRSTDLVARFGGDEFVVVLEGTPGTVEAVVVPSIERALAEPVALGPVTVSGRASIGVAAIRPGERADAGSLLHRADAEMYRAKRSHRSGAEPPAGTPDPPPGAPLVPAS